MPLDLNFQGLAASDRLFVLRCVTFATLCVQLVLNCWGESSLRHCHCLESDKVGAAFVFSLFEMRERGRGREIEGEGGREGEREREEGRESERERERE